WRKWQRRYYGSVRTERLLLQDIVYLSTVDLLRADTHRMRTPDAFAAILFWMSRAFVKEDVDPPERSGRKRSASGLPPGATNYITARGEIGRASCRERE